MRKYLLVILLIIKFLVGCDSKSVPVKSTFKSLEEEKIQTSNLKISAIELLPNSIAWTDGGSFYLLIFEPNKVHFIFNPTCAYWFPSKIKENEIIFYWEMNEDCIFNRGLSKTFQNIENPEIGKPFGKIKLLNDSTLFIDYYYTDWIKKINTEEFVSIDTLFPSFFKKIEFNQ